MLAEEGFVHFVDGAVAVDAGVVSGQCRESAIRHVRQLRRRRHDRRRARDRRDGFHERPVHAARESDLHRRRPALSGRAIGLRRAQGVRARGRVRLLHGRDHAHEGHDPGDVHRSGTRHSGIGTGRATTTCPDWCLRPRAWGLTRALTAKCTSSRASSGSRRSSSTRTRTSGRASWSCPSSRCTRRRTG